MDIKILHLIEISVAAGIGAAATVVLNNLADLNLGVYAVVVSGGLTILISLLKKVAMG